VSQRVPAALRRLIKARARGRCEYCLIHEDDSHFPHQPDHVVAQKHRGPTHEDNLAWACYLCNLLKGSDIASVDIESGQIVRLFNPRSDQWTNHFRLDNGQIVPLTPVGRVTEYLLQFNQPQAVQERRWLVEARRYPR
jgi:5-methylcytosine-specific restriction endonuclease McrA